MQRIVITGIGLTAPNGNSLTEFREALLQGKSGVQHFETRYLGKTFAGICDFEQTRYQSRRELRSGTRAGSIAIYCMGESIVDAKLDLNQYDKNRLGIYLGITEHGNVETENEVYNISKFDYDTKLWSHHHNPRTVANNPAGEVSIKFGITGPHYTIGAACAAGNLGLIQGLQQLCLGEVDVAFAGGVSESIQSFGIFAGFKSQGALAHGDNPATVSRPFDKKRNGIVVAEGGAIYTLERLEDAQIRGAKIYGEIVGYAINSDATSTVLPNDERQVECMQQALFRSNITAEDIDIVSSHATGTGQGDIQESKALAKVFGQSKKTYINNTKSYIGHAMGAAGILELSGNIPSFADSCIHPTINLSERDEECQGFQLVANEVIRDNSVEYIFNNSFGMLGINSALIIKSFK